MNSPEAKIKQFRHETDTWKRNIEFMMQENTYLKNRLAEVLKAELADEELLTAAEQFQNLFIREDEVIHLLRKDVAGMDKLLLREIYEDGHLLANVQQTQKKLSAEIRHAVAEFNKLKFDFNNYLSEVL
jgi:regulator of replication initiation timing